MEQPSESGYMVWQQAVCETEMVSQNERGCLPILSFKGTLLHLLAPHRVSSQRLKNTTQIVHRCCTRGKKATHFFFPTGAASFAHMFLFMEMELDSLPALHKVAKKKKCRVRALGISSQAELTQSCLLCPLGKWTNMLEK